MLEGHEIDLINDILNQNAGQIELVDIKPKAIELIHASVRTSFLYSQYDGLSFHRSLKVANCKHDNILFIIGASYRIISGKRTMSGSELQLVGLKKLDNNYGNILIRPETLEDKFAEFFKKTEIDFKEYPRFSSKYFFLADNEDLGKAFASSQRLDIIEKEEDIVVEIKGDLLISKYTRVLNQTDFKTMLEFISKI
jgi:hypothetical protein